MTEPSRPTSSSITNYARTARRAIRLQLIVAGLALLATIVFGVMITGQTAKLNAVNADLEAARSRLAMADNATQAVLQAASALASGDPARYNAAIESLRAVRRDLALVAAELDGGDAGAARDNLRDVRVSVTRTLASALFTRAGRSREELNEAISLETENLAQPGLPSEQVFASSIALATYHCEAGHDEEFRNLIDGAFVTTHLGATQNGVLPDKCRSLVPPVVNASSGAGDEPPYNPANADPEFRIRTVYLHIGSDADRAAAQLLGQKLCDAGYAVPGIETASAPRASELRYYYAEQVEEAEHLASLFAIDPSPARWWSSPTVRQLGGFTNLDRHIAEIWLTPSRSMPGATTPVTAAQATFRCSPAAQTGATDIPAIVAQLTSDDKAARLSAGQLVSNLMRTTDDSAIASSLIAQLQPPRLEQLSSAARLNVLYMLNVEPVWSGRADAPALQQALATVRARASQGIAIGGQTNDCLLKLEAKLKGEAAADRCGGM
jgi:hypothetical protein